MSGQFSTAAWAEKFRIYGQAVLVGATLVAGTVAVTSKAVAVINAGPEAKAKTVDLDHRVTRLERQSRFVVRGIEKLTATKYVSKRWARDEAAAEADD